MLLAPSAWLQRHARLLRPGGSVLDVACGSGRHALWLAAQGFAVTGVDRDAAALQGLRGHIDAIEADLEGAPWPLPGRRFDGIVVTNYLWRALWPALRGALAPGGVLIYETFGDGQQLIGKPSRPEFLLRPGELLRACEGLYVVAFEDGFEASVPRHVQRIVAVSETEGTIGPARYEIGAGAGPAR